MATERNSKTMAEFFKFTQIGQAVAGLITSFKTSENGPFALFEPVLIRDNPDEPPKRYAGVAVGLSTDLKIKLDMQQDVKKFFSIEFAEKEPTSKGSDRKIFRVLELTRDEMKALAAGTLDTGDIYRKPVARVNATVGGTATEEDDDLPF